MNPLRFLILSLCFMLTGFSNLIATELQTGREIADSTNIEPSLVKQLLWEARDIKSSADNNQIDDREGPQRDPAIILIAPNEIQLDLEPGISEEREITVANNGDEPLEFTTFIDVVSAPDQSDIVNMKVLVLTDNEGLGGGQVMVEGAIEAGVLEENLNVIGSTDFPNIDLYDYDVLAFTDQQRWQYFQTYMWYRELIDEWIQAGGVLLMSGPTTLAIVPFTFPADVFYMDTGFLRSTHNIYEYQGECNPLIHGLIEDENDDLPEEIVVGACNYGAFLRPILQQINGISNVKTIYRQAFNDMAGDDAVTLITYDFGEGHILGSSLYASAFLYQPEDQLKPFYLQFAPALFHLFSS
ncbi:MAG: hypothetical protein HN757_13860, partial [Calditrichaeota bacterium]|nr:hypothetical protein [Calditrichota bacterium]